MSPTYITKEGLKKLQEELIYLKKEKMPEIVERIARAKELGDLSENAEYHDAKDEQGFVAGRIVDLENMINKSEIIQANSSKETVSVGCNIKVRCGSDEYNYTIVGSNEANPSKGLISNESPIGRAFLGCKIGEKVTVKIPKGEMECEVLEIA
jgi:transcription elongation factor GreA